MDRVLEVVTQEVSAGRVRAYRLRNYGSTVDDLVLRMGDYLTEDDLERFRACRNTLAALDVHTEQDWLDQFIRLLIEMVARKGLNWTWHENTMPSPGEVIADLEGMIDSAHGLEKK